MEKLPTLFVSHGSPMMAVLDCPTSRFWSALGPQLPRPKAILCISAHWEMEQPVVSTVAQPETIHDFGGFPRELFRLQYPSPGAPDLARRVQGLLTSQGIPCGLDGTRGLDHGTWVPLQRMFPKADIPVTQLALQSHLNPTWHYKLGEALKPLRDEGVLIMGSGAITHNLSAFFGGKLTLETPILPWVADYRDWMAEHLARDDRAALLDYRRHAPHVVENHPTDEHLLPLYVALGAGGQATRLHDDVTYGVLAMDVYSFA